MRSPVFNAEFKLLVGLSCCVLASCAGGPTAPRDLAGRARYAALFAQGTWEYASGVTAQCTFNRPDWAKDSDGPLRQRFRCSEIVVQFSSSTSSAEASTISEAAGTTLVSVLSSPPSGLVALVQCPARDEQMSLARLFERRAVLTAFPNFEVVVE